MNGATIAAIAAAGAAASSSNQIAIQEQREKEIQFCTEYPEKCKPINEEPNTIALAFFSVPVLLVLGVLVYIAYDLVRWR